MIKNMPLGKKMAITILVPILFLTILALTALAVIEAMSVIRAYVGGEGLYSKYQKDAVIYLLKYADTYNEQDYKSFLKSIQVPLEARKARLELEKPAADIEVACQAFIRGQNHPEDVKPAAYLFRFSRHVRGDSFEKLHTVWAEADSLNVKLKNLGIELHETVSKGRGDKGSFRSLKNRIYTINRDLLVLENEFSSALGKLARSVKKGLLCFILILLSLSLALSGLILFLISTDIRKKTSLLKNAAEKVGAGDYETRINLESGDEFGTIAMALRRMAEEFSKNYWKLKTEIEARKHAEEQIHALNQQMIKAQENERQMISCELHDVVAQDLSSAKITCDLLLDPHLKTTLSEIKQKIAGVSKMLKKTISTVRDFSYELHPPLFDKRGLVRSVSEYCDDFSKHNNMIIDFDSAGMHKLNLAFIIRINLFRLIQEGLNNIKKHAHANCVTIKMAASFPNIALSLKDDGRGFDVERLRETASRDRQMGLGKMKERVGMLQGEIKIKSRPMQGTKIFIQIPYKKEKDVPEERLDL